MEAQSLLPPVERHAGEPRNAKSHQAPAVPTPVGRGSGRVVDCFLAGFLLAVSAPVILAAAVLVKLTSRGPAIYAQTRLGKGRREYTIYKLRTMTYNCEADTGATWSTGKSDQRVTPVGRFLRRTHIDELPQLWNVLKGEMSLVGPRPERPEFVPKLERAIPGYADRMAVRPGLTGLAQVQLAPDTEVDDVRRKLRYDLYYLKHASLDLDLRILAATAVKVLGLPFSVSRIVFGVPGAREVEPMNEPQKNEPQSHREHRDRTPREQTERKLF